MRIAVVGSGITGLCAAYAARRAGAQVRLLERAGRVGGVIETHKEAGFLVDFGPNTLRLALPEVVELIEALGLQTLEAHPGQDRRMIVRNNQLRTLPRSPWGILTTQAWSFWGKLRLLREPWVAPGTGEDESLADFIRRRLGQELLDYGADPFVSGIYASDPQTLSTRWAFSNLYAMEQEAGSLTRGFWSKRKPLVRPRTVSFASGMQALPEALAASLPKDALTLNAHILAIDAEKGQIHWEDTQGQHREFFDKIIITTPAWTTLPFEKKIQEQLLCLQQIPYAPVSVVALGFKKSQLQPLKGFGFLVPAKENKRFLGTLFSSFLFPNSAPEDHCLLTNFIGGQRQPSLAAAPTQTLVDLLCEELAPLLSLSGAPTFVAHRYWPHAVAQYGLQHGKHLEQLLAFQRSFPKIVFTGHFHGGVSLPLCMQQGLRV